MNLFFRRILVAAWVFVLEGVVLIALFPGLAPGKSYTTAIRPFLLVLVVLSMVQAALALFRQGKEDENAD